MAAKRFRAEAGITFGSVMIAGEIRKRLGRAGFKVKETHRDIGK